MKTFGSRLKKCRMEFGFDQKTLAQKLGKENHSVISNWENDRAKPNADDLLELSILLNISIDYLMRGVVANDTPTDGYRTIKDSDYANLLERAYANSEADNKRLKNAIADFDKRQLAEPILQ